MMGMPMMGMPPGGMPPRGMPPGGLPPAKRKPAIDEARIKTRMCKFAKVQLVDNSCSETLS